MAAAIIYLLVWYGPDLIARHDVGTVTQPQRAVRLQQARDAARGRLLTLGAGVFAAGALVYTALNFRLSREGQVTDRYTKAIGQLGAKELDVRIGGIYALERVARDSAKDHPTVMEVLAAFIREHSREPWPEVEPGGEPQPRATRPDVQAAVTVMGRRNLEHDRQPVNLARVALHRADLAGADLAGANLGGVDLKDADLRQVTLTRANLNNAILVCADLTGADLTGAKLTRAHLSRGLAGAELTGAHLSDDRMHELMRHAERAAFGSTVRAADLTGANLNAADLTDADLRQVTLTRANLKNAILVRADLTGADLTGAKLTGADLSVAHYTRADTTTDPDILRAILKKRGHTGANLKDADLTGADLTDAILTGADLTNAKFDGAPPKGWTRDLKQGGSSPATSSKRAIEGRTDWNGVLKT